MTATFVNLQEIKAAIAEVRDDRKSTNWVLLSYEGENSNNVVLLGRGEGGPNELIDHLHDDIHTKFVFNSLSSFDRIANIVGYGIVRLAEKFDDSDTVKFVFIKWIGEKIHRMLRARLGTHSGAIKGII